MNLEITETRDWHLAWNISQEPTIFDRITNDSWGLCDIGTRANHVRLTVEKERNHTLLVTMREIIMGCFLLDEKEEGIYEVHTMLLPVCRGKLAIEAGKLAMAFAFKLSGVKKLVSYCPMNLPEIYLFARYCGFRKAGVAAIKWIKNGIEYPMRVVEATINDLPKEEALCH